MKRNTVGLVGATAVAILSTALWAACEPEGDADRTAAGASKVGAHTLSVQSAPTNTERDKSNGKGGEPEGLIDCGILSKVYYYYNCPGASAEDKEDFCRDRVSDVCNTCDTSMVYVRYECVEFQYNQIECFAHCYTY